MAEISLVHWLLVVPEALGEGVSGNQEGRLLLSPGMLVRLPAGMVVGIIINKDCCVLWFFINARSSLETGAYLHLQICGFRF